jgi:hypothetical protein
LNVRVFFIQCPLNSIDVNHQSQKPTQAGDILPVPSPDAVIETPVDPNLPVEEALEDAAISPQILLSTAAAIILAVVA